jgi:exosortase/archaeosortase family protein
VLYGELNKDSLRTRVKLVVLAAVLAMLTNWIRIFIIAVAAHLTDMQHYLVSEEHYTFGWIMFVGTMVIFFLIVRRWPVQDLEAAPSGEKPPSSGAISWRGAALALTSLLIAPMWLLADRNTIAADDLPRLLPSTGNGWSAQETKRQEWQPTFVGADVTERRSYSKSATLVEGFAALYASQHQGKELIGFNNSMTGESLRVRRRAASAGTDRWMEMEVVDGRGESWLLWYAYRLDQQWYDRTLPLQLQYGVRSLTSAPLSAVVAFRTSCAGEDCSAAQATLREFTANRSL